MIFWKAGALAGIFKLLKTPLVLPSKPLLPWELTGVGCVNVRSLQSILLTTIELMALLRLAVNDGQRMS